MIHARAYDLYVNRPASFFPRRGDNGTEVL